MQSSLTPNLKFITDLPKPILIIGMAKSGQSCLKLLLSAGVNRSDILTYDKIAGIADISDTNLIEKLMPKTLVVSPGVSLQSSWIKKLINDGAVLTSELSIAASILTSEIVIGVTGSLGKSTTVSLLGFALSDFSDSYFVGGNIGTPLSEYANDLIINKRKKADWIVLELSSYQLENCKNLNLKFSAITFLDPNHLERYDSLEQYYKTKIEIHKITQDILFLNESGGDLKDFYLQYKHLIKIPVKFINSQQEPLKRFNLQETKLFGKHNLDNLSLAASIALACGWPDRSIFKMKDYVGLEHRLEFIGSYQGKIFVNDSKATAIESVRTAIDAIKEKQTTGKIYVLLGGRDKNLPWKKLNNYSNTQNLYFIFFGECANLAKEKSGLEGFTFPKLNNALDFAIKKMQTNDTLLLSPGGSSLDEFKNFEERGQFFKEYISRKLTLP